MATNANMELRMRLPILLSCALALAGCGFHPRAQLALPATLGPVVVQTADPYSPLGLELSSTLERAGLMSKPLILPSAAATRSFCCSVSAPSGT